MPAQVALDDDYYDLGALHRPVSTRSIEAQTWFDRGLVWSYGFNHEESAECFTRAIACDPDCAMAYWGLAYALGPNYNKPWEFFDGEELESTVARTHKAVEQAKSKARAAAPGALTPVEKALVDALEFRYPQAQAAADCSIWNGPYADAMASVHAAFPDDLDVATLYADAMMNLTPWRLWDLATGLPATAEGARTVEIKRVLERALGLPGGLAHPGLLHLYIHLMEMSPTPEVAMPVADHLRGLVPDSGHLNHMPTHLDILCGDYRRAIASNMTAIRADEKFLARAGALNFYTLYRSHDYHFRLYGAMFAGQSRVALETAGWIERSIPEALLRVESPPMADWLESFLGMRVHVYVRFGRWRDILDGLQFPADRSLYCVTTALIHYARGVACAATGQIQEAEKERELFRVAVTNVPPTRTLFNNTCLDILAVADAMLDGELWYRRGQLYKERQYFDAAFAHLRRAIALDDALPYDEPWGWMQPPRHAYGALLLEQGRVQEAAVVYAADLGVEDDETKATLPRALQHPNNVWSLHGYHECLTRLGRTAEARLLKPQLNFAVAMADVPIKSSCFCRTEQ
jgi:tetratricopeptide (TPR) repeat protein